MTSGLPIVAALKCLRSLGSRQGSAPLRADDAVARDRRNQHQRGPAHTATGALIAGQGS